MGQISCMLPKIQGLCWIAAFFLSKIKPENKKHVWALQAQHEHETSKQNDKVGKRTEGSDYWAVIFGPSTILHGRVVSLGVSHINLSGAIIIIQLFTTVKHSTALHWHSYYRLHSNKIILTTTNNVS